MTPSTVTSSVLAALAVALFVRWLVPPPARLADRVRPYTATTRARYGKSGARAISGSAWARLGRTMLAPVASRLGKLLDRDDGAATKLRLRQTGLYRGLDDDQALEAYRFRQLGAVAMTLAASVGVAFSLRLPAPRAMALCVTLSAVASSPDLIKNMSEINEMNVAGGRWLATNLGVETVAPRMVKKHLGVKTKPFQPEEWGAVVREGCKVLNQNNWFPALTLIIGWPDETPDETQYTIDLIEDFKETNMRGLVAPLLYQDFSEKNSMHFGNLNEAQFTLFWRCWEHNLRVINDIIPIIIRNKTYGPAMKVFMAALIKAGTWAIMRYLRGLSKELFNGQVPEDIVARYSGKRSVTTTPPPRL